MSKLIALIHNSPVIIDVVKKVFENVYPDAKIINLMDESLLRDIKERGGIDVMGTRRICRYTLCAEDLDADAVLMTCSSLCNAAFASRVLVHIPVFAINEPMAIEAVEKGSKIVILGTLESVLVPTIELIKAKAKEMNKAVEVEQACCCSAFEALINGDSQKHDELLMEEVKKADDKGDVIVFGQGSMSRLIPRARQTVSSPILECLESGVKQVKDHFDKS